MMLCNSTYTNTFRCCNNFVVRTAGCIMLLLCCFFYNVYANEEDPPYYETSVFLIVQGIGGQEVSAVINSDSVFLSIADVFDFLKIRHKLSSGMDSVSGSFINEGAVFLIDKVNKRIQYQGKVFILHKSDFVLTETGLYLKMNYFNKVFGLDCKFNFRSLSMVLSTKQELPAIREMKLDMMRRNINKLKGHIKADTIIPRHYSLFQFGVADWSVVATQRLPGVNNTWLSLGLGATVAGGEATVSLNYNNYAQKTSSTHDSNTIKPFDKRQQYYRWRFVNNDHRALRQVIAGKIFTQSVSSIFNPVVGMQITNTSTAYRRSFGSYTLSNFTGPNWTVELYVNDALVDYTTADASGFFTFQVPLVYGNSVLKLRFYGPWGEERINEENVSIPFNFLPLHEFEYTASAGIVEDTAHSKFSRLQMNYGITRHITVGGGIEYLSSVTTGKTMPFMNASLRIGSNMLFSGEYTHGVRAKGILSYRLPSNLQIELNYTHFTKDQKAIIYNYREQRKIIISRPFISKKFSLFTRVTLDQIILPDTKYTTAEWLLSGALFKVGTNLTTYAVFQPREKPYVYSNLALSFRLPGQLTVTPQAQYEYNTNRLMTLRCEMAKYLFHNGYVSISYEKNFKGGGSNIGIGLRYDFSFSQVGFSAMHGRNSTTLVQSARGSLMHNGPTGYNGTSNRSSLGTGGVVFLPFLDLNNSGRRDPGEPNVYGLKVKSHGGRIFHNRRDTTVRITDMEPYVNTFIELERNSFENISWQVKKPVISVMIEPNQLKLIEVPVSIMGEVSGNVYLKDNDELKGIGRIKVCIYSADSSLAACILTEFDGFFSYIGLTPGKYTAEVDKEQLQKLKMTASPFAIPFQISDNREGDVIDGLGFTLQPNQ
ncbi:hypothetical protein SAMN05518672_103220 [Chitinophaga sp. CF118]|uniref:hypothetical protein n=1 Tax=Chitinophaga sp. CF118 TaxID=1884367 RepID=UPI0008EA5017|nr:hypothetical protein [Chitinophaga sp. CF118]SFD78834.1 hypothetical protein SAMN05518672_103220 [Chitinophaga sp. CF118]